MVLYFILPQRRCPADCFKDFRTFLKEAFKKQIAEKNQVFATNSNFLILLPLQPNHGGLRVNLNSNWTNSLYRNLGDPQQILPPPLYRPGLKVYLSYHGPILVYRAMS